MKKKSVLAWLLSGLVVSGIGALGCGRLGSGKAQEILEKRLADAGAESCVWTHVKGGVYTDVDHLGVRECVAELEKAGIAKAGECRDKDSVPSVCLERAIVPPKGAKPAEDGLTFRCGEFKLLDVVSVENDPDGSAKVIYRREFTAPLLAEIVHCTGTTLYRPDEGQHTKTVYFKQVDGKWDVKEGMAGWLY